MTGYQLEEIIGEGSLGRVYRARHRVLDRPVAVKFLYDHLAQDERYAARFLKEARRAAVLDHPGVVRIDDTGTQEGRPYIVSQLLEGETLAARLRRGPLPSEGAVAIARDVLAALAAAHAQ